MMIRVAVFLLIVIIVVAIGIVALAASRFQLASETSSAYDPITCMPDEETKEKVRSILHEATEEALKQHVVKMHTVWMADERGQPARATNGTRQGIRAFLSGYAFLKKWNPPLCGTTSP